MGNSVYEVLFWCAFDTLIRNGDVAMRREINIQTLVGE